ncbi:SCO family protein [Rubellimicrobium aerolatum]|uniref:SCO family protein n=1 Tax=Rubellimicrobium aerolatum TaxID=490979 RepID=A0ABW0SH65_9RHOB|nr:SCO family protein [Rubellimicrobium aerolatum]MBP1807632.1 protein SCO1/2 [Rubellimicrobium aerolatum]
MRRTFPTALILALLALAPAARAHDEAAGIDSYMLGEERFFQVIDQPAPPFDLVNMDGAPVNLADFADKVVVLDFVFASCTDLCPLQSQVMADVQGKVNASPMRDMVEFVTVTTDPTADTPEVMRAYGEAQGLDPFNWRFLTIRPEDAEDATRALSEAYANTFTPTEDGQQMHGAVFHVIDRGGRLAAKFHGLEFEPVNMVLYVNGLTNEEHGPEEAGGGFWGFFD